MANKTPIYEVGDVVEVVVGKDRGPARVAQIKKAKGRKSYKLEYKIDGSKRVADVAVGDERGKIFPIVVESAPVPPPTFVVVLPENLKRLVDEADEKINNGFLVKLPIQEPVATIVGDMVAFFTIHPYMQNRDEKLLVANASIDRFEAMLEDNLVCDLENHQRREFYERKMIELNLPTDTPRDVAFTHGFRYTDYYGMIHYIRLMQRLPEVAPLIDPTGGITEGFKDAVNVICKYLSYNLDSSIPPEIYVEAPRDGLPRAN